MADISEFEILFSGLIPGLPLPLVAQGYFLQVSNNTLNDQTVSLSFIETSDFKNATYKVGDLNFNLLIANYLDGSGNANLYSDFVTIVDNNPSFGFDQISIPAGETFVFGVQAFPTPAASLPDTHPAKSNDPKLFVAPAEIPQFGIQWHGTVILNCSTGDTGDTLSIYPTTRGVFFDPIVEATTGQTTDVVTIGISTGQTYSSVPTISGTASVSVPT